MIRLDTTLRGLARERAFTVTVLLTLALGIGVCLTMFSVVRAVLLEPLPFPDSERLVAVWMTNPRQGFDRDVVSYPQFRDWRDQTSEVFDGLAAFSSAPGSLSAAGSAREVRVSRVSEAFFPLMAAPAAIGRTLAPDDYAPGRHRVLVLSDSLWRSAFGADAGIVGRTIAFNTEPYVVVGVLPAGVAFPLDAEAWAPLTPLPENRDLFESRGGLWLSIVARLAPGVSPATAQDTLIIVEKRLVETYPDATPGTGVLVRRLHDDIVSGTARSVWLLQGAVVLVLLIACANVSNLLLARATARQRELATRAALGAGWARLAGESFREVLVLAGAGTGLGLLLARWLMGLVRSAGPAQVPFLTHAGIDGWVVATAAVLCVLTALLVGVAPVLHQSRVDLNRSLKVGGRSSRDTGGSRRTQNGLVAAQVALAVMLLAGAGLLLESFAGLLAIETGYTTRSALTATITLPAQKYSDAGERVRVWNELLRRVGDVRGVESAGATSTVLFGRLPAASPMTAEGRPDLPDEVKALPVVIGSVTPGYFDAIGHPLLYGRVIDERDASDATPVVVVNEALGRTFFGRADVVGRRITFGDAADPRTTWFTIVGVVKDVRRASVGPELEARPEVYIPYTQRSRQAMVLVARTAGDPLALVGSIRAAVAAVDADVPLARAQSLDTLLSARLDQRQFLTTLAIAFAGLAVLLSAVGLHGVVSYGVSRRLHEFGVYLALGASRRTVARLVLGQGMKVSLAGAAVGALGTVAITRLVESQLYGVGRADFLVFAAVAALLVATVLAASWLPARRAARVDPMRVLRHE